MTAEQLLQELKIRMNTDPKRYEKNDYLVLINALEAIISGTAEINSEIETLISRMDTLDPQNWDAQISAIRDKFDELSESLNKKVDDNKTTVNGFSDKIATIESQLSLAVSAVSEIGYTATKQYDTVTLSENNSVRAQYMKIGNLVVLAINELQIVNTSAEETFELPEPYLVPAYGIGSCGEENKKFFWSLVTENGMCLLKVQPFEEAQFDNDCTVTFTVQYLCN